MKFTTEELIVLELLVMRNIELQEQIGVESTGSKTLLDKIHKKLGRLTN